jgi:hypothetical protein
VGSETSATRPGELSVSGFQYAKMLADGLQASSRTPVRVNNGQNQERAKEEEKRGDKSIDENMVTIRHKRNTREDAKTKVEVHTGLKQFCALTEFVIATRTVR